MKRRLPRIDRTRVRTVSARTRPSRVQNTDEARPHRKGASLRAFLAGLPDILAGADLRAVIDASARAARRDKLLLWGFGAHLIKVGLAPVLVDLMERGVVGGVLMNGAGCVHDLELAMMGRTSEDVARSLDDGSFGMARQTAEVLNAAIAAGDVALAISTSGNSPNVIAAVEEAQRRQLRTIGLLGKGGGKLAHLVELPLVVPSSDTQRIQECHIAIGHAIAELVDRLLFPELGRS